MDFGIVYHIQDAHQFWSELEDIVSVRPDATLSELDLAVLTFMTFCSSYHEQYLQTKVQQDHACTILFGSELFKTHSARSSELILAEAPITTDPHRLLIIYKILLQYGRREPSFFRPSKRWEPILPLLMDHISVEVDDIWIPGGEVFIEAKLKLLVVELLYEICRVQRFKESDFQVLDDAFLNHLFEQVEQTRDMPDEALNYGLIKLIAAINEQFMVSALPQQSPTQTNIHRSKKSTDQSTDAPSGSSTPEVTNRVLRVLMRRLGSSKTFSENMIFMLNRAGDCPEDLVMQLLVLKVLYLIFNTPKTQEFFYTNDLRVLVDVFMRELADLPEESEALRHTYLRVLYPLLTNTQLRDDPYRAPQLRNMLESLVAFTQIRDVNPTTRRLVDRCLSASCFTSLPNHCIDSPRRTSSPPPLASESLLAPPSPEKDKGFKTLHKSVSVDVITKMTLPSSPPPTSPRTTTSTPGVPTLPNIDSLTLSPSKSDKTNGAPIATSVTIAVSKTNTNGAAPVPERVRPEKAKSDPPHIVVLNMSEMVEIPSSTNVTPSRSPAISSPGTPDSIRSTTSSPVGGLKHRRSPPPIPSKRRKGPPPAVPPRTRKPGLATTEQTSHLTVRSQPQNVV